MSILNNESSLILIVDIQKKLLNAVYNKESLERNAEIVAKASSLLNIPVIITEQYPKGLGETIPNISSNVNQNSMYFEKTSFSALDNNDILNAIKAFDRKQIVIMGIESHICVSQTAAALSSQGYDVTLIKDCSGSRSESEHIAGIERMKDNGVNIITTEIALFEWLKDSKNPKFKEVQALIK